MKEASLLRNRARYSCTVRPSGPATGAIVVPRCVAAQQRNMGLPCANKSLSVLVNVWPARPCGAIAEISASQQLS